MDFYYVVALVLLLLPNVAALIVILVGLFRYGAGVCVRCAHRFAMHPLCNGHKELTTWKAVEIDDNLKS